MSNEEFWKKVRFLGLVGGMIFYSCTMAFIIAYVMPAILLSMKCHE